LKVVLNDRPLSANYAVMQFVKAPMEQQFMWG
jgi:hypothetical protein